MIKDCNQNDLKLITFTVDDVNDCVMLLKNRKLCRSDGIKHSSWTFARC